MDRRSGQRREENTTGSRQKSPTASPHQQRNGFSRPTWSLGGTDDDDPAGSPAPDESPMPLRERQLRDSRRGSTANVPAQAQTPAAEGPSAQPSAHPGPPKRTSSAMKLFRLGSSHRLSEMMNPDHNKEPKKTKPSTNGGHNAHHHGHYGSMHLPMSGGGSRWKAMVQRGKHNLRGLYVRKPWKKRSELDRLQEVQRSQLLFNELFMATPVVMLMSAQLQSEDENDKRVPILVQQLSLKVTRDDDEIGYRHFVRINLAYGNGPAMIQWSIVRGHRDFLWLKSRLGSDRMGSAALKELKHPHLPKPKQLNDDEELDPADDDDDDDDDEEIGSRPVSRAASRNRRPSLDERDEDRQRTGQNPDDEDKTFEQAIEDYLKQLLQIYQFRPDCNKILQFLELSNMSLRLAPEGGFHGKEGSLVLRSRASDMGWRVSHLHPKDLAGMITRHTPKWFVVRESYIVAVDSIHSTGVREVFLIDPHFELVHITEDDPKVFEQKEALAKPHGVRKTTRAKILFLHLKNNGGTMKLAAYSDRDLRRWQASLLQMKQLTPWSKKNRFDSFAPVRKNVFGQWFVDGRDYMWVLSEALENARDTIYILDWWLSPELYLRRPPEGNQQWRLDRILKRKAEQGVKIFVVVYRNVEFTIHIDSSWTKHSLLDLHPNIHVIRSPHQLNQRDALFWAHHEKLCVIDTTVAFNGGIDLCYGRWDTYHHKLTDDNPAAFSNDPNVPTQTWVGKDYTNERITDYHDLNKYWEDLLDRNNTPRMPWHDVHQMVVGQPARDMARHFVQRWNYVIRQHLPSRRTPLLIPPPDFTQTELDRLGLTGTCEYQVLRSSSDWSLGLKDHEQSIQNAYLKLIQESEHLVYIENQFFITSTEVDGIIVQNQIGNALVDRIVRAHENGEAWKCFVLLPLLPGFPAEVDTNEAASVRVISQCQFNSISRGPNSLFYRLESLGIRPDQYIHFMSLRKWDKYGKENGDRLVTEILYIHGKTMVVDDRAAIIGSANINERSMRGVRDSEIAVCVRDTKVVESRMAGKPWKAAKFAYTLRMRLMREHLGVDIDKLDTVERLCELLEASAQSRPTHQPQPSSSHMQQGSNQLQVRRSVPNSFTASPDPSEPASPNASKIFSQTSSAHQQNGSQSNGYVDGHADHDQIHAMAANLGFDNVEDLPPWLYPELHTFNWYAGTSVNKGVREHKKVSTDSRVQGNAEHHADVAGDGYDQYSARLNSGKVKLGEALLQSVPPNEAEETKARELMKRLLRDHTIKNLAEFKLRFYSELADRPDCMHASTPNGISSSLPYLDDEAKRVLDAYRIPINPWEFDDPLDKDFLENKWFAAAERNTFIYRQVFRCQPDDEVETWKDYKKFQAHQERFYAKQREDGGPDVLRKTGHHEPERVDKHVLSGTIPKTNKEGLRSPGATPGVTPGVTPGPSPGTSPMHSPVLGARQTTPLASPLASANGTPAVSPRGSPRGSFSHGTGTPSHANGSINGRLDPSRRLNASTAPKLQPVESVNDGEDYFTTRPPSGSRAAGSQPSIPSVTVNGSSQMNGNANGTMNGHSKNHDPLASRRLIEDQHLEDDLAEIDERRSSHLEAQREFRENENDNESPTSTDVSSTLNGQKRGPPITTHAARKWGHFDHVLDAQVAEDLLQGVTGHLVVYPTEWLNRELDSGNWNFQKDRMTPLEIYD